MNKKILFTIIISICCMIGCFFWGKHVGKEKEVEIIEKEKVVFTESNLSDWEVLELAIMKTESEFNITAQSNGALGLFQITEIFVEECNRLIGEPKWIHTDAFVPQRALEMFNFYQNEHNPQKDYIRGINVHNPGGESINYTQKVLNNMEYIRKYERIRNMVIKYGEEGR